MKIEETNGRFNIVEFDEVEAYSIACKVEADGIAFYTKLAENSQKPEIKETLEFLAAEEKKHLKFFDDALSRLNVSNDVAEDNDLLGSMDVEVFQPYASIDDLASLIKDIKKALRLGIAVEKKSIALYEACAQALKDAAAKNALLNIINEEKKHKTILEALLKKTL